MNSSASLVFQHEGVKTPDTVLVRPRPRLVAKALLCSVGPGPLSMPVAIMILLSLHPSTHWRAAGERENICSPLGPDISGPHLVCCKLEPAESSSGIIEMPDCAEVRKVLILSVKNEPQLCPATEIFVLLTRDLTGTSDSDLSSPILWL